MKICFYNHFGNGDLIESRMFALAFMKMAGVATAEYAHQSQYAGSFEDLWQLKPILIKPQMQPNASLTRVGDTLWVNTWVGRGHDQKMNGYVLQPGVGCVIERIMQMWDDLLVEAGLPLLPGTAQEYLPRIDYTRCSISPKVAEYLNDNIGKKLVLICNGKTTSHQCANFDYHPILDHIPMRDGVRYLFTEKVPGFKRADVTFTDDITERMTIPQHAGWDLTAISYLSRYCDIIVGRCSGAQMYAQTLENWMDGNKTLVCFTHHRNGACFVRYPEALGLRMNVVWSPTVHAQVAAEIIRELL